MRNENQANFSRNTLVLMLAVAMAATAIAGSDTTFSGPLTSITNWMTGSLGKLFSLGALAVGLGVGIVKQSVMAVAVGVGLALAASAGPSVLAGIFSAVI